MTKNRTKNITFILIAVIAMIAGAWLGSYEEPSQKQKQAETIQGVILPTAKTIRPFHLFDHDEQAFTEDSLKGQWSLLFVGYTQCPDICPAALSVLKQVHQLMTRQSLKVPRVVFI